MQGVGAGVLGPVHSRLCSETLSLKRERKKGEGGEGRRRGGEEAKEGRNTCGDVGIELVTVAVNLDEYLHCPRC